MTLDEAIKHAEEVADRKKREKQKWDKWLESDYDHRAVAEKVSCELCAEEHRQLAEWLRDYKRLLKQEPCEDAISRQAALECCRNEWEEEVEMRLRSLPSVNPQPKIGHWIEHPEIETSVPEYLMFYECSECGGKLCFCKPDIHKKRFCNYCGCRMVEPQESEIKDEDTN